MDALTGIGIFMLGAAAGSIVSYAQHRHVVTRYQWLVEHLAGSSDMQENKQQPEQTGA